LLKADEFAGKMQELAHGELIDVRTAEEYAAGHIENAQNLIWDGSNIDFAVSTIEKETPLFVYCLSGGRSTLAAAKLREKGYEQVYELENGMLGWREAKYPEKKPEAPKVTGMTMDDYQIAITSDKIILVDFYADWCGPCKMIKPFIDELASENPDKLEVIRINSDDNQELAKQLSITDLPTLKVYKKGKETWQHVGGLPQEQIASGIFE